MQCERVELWRERERAPTSLYLQLVSCLLHHKVVQALQIPPTVMLITLLPCSEDDQGGVTAHLDNRKKKKRISPYCHHWVTMASLQAENMCAPTTRTVKSALGFYFIVSN